MDLSAVFNCDSAFFDTCFGNAKSGGLAVDLEPDDADIAINDSIMAVTIVSLAFMMDEKKVLLEGVPKMQESGIAPI